MTILGTEASLLVGSTGSFVRNHVTRRQLRVEGDVGQFAEILSAPNNEGSNAADSVLERLREAGVVGNSTSLAPEWAGSAWAFHRHVRNIPPPDWSTPDGLRRDVAFMKAVVSAEEPPPVFSHVAGLPVPLEPWSTDATDALRIHDTQTVAGEKDLDEPTLALFLNRSLGVTEWKKLPITGLHPRRTSPSGGSRHPAEGYILTDGVGRMGPGAYHYDSQRRQPVLLEDWTADRVRDFIFREIVVVHDRLRFQPRACVILAAAVERNMYRYRDSRSYKVLFLDAGHLMQTAAYYAASLGRPMYRSYNVRVGPVLEAFNLDGLSDLLVGAMVLG